MYTFNQYEQLSKIFVKSCQVFGNSEFKDVLNRKLKRNKRIFNFESGNKTPELYFSNFVFVKSTPVEEF